MKLCGVSGQLLIGGVSEQQPAIDHHLNDDRVIALSLWLAQSFIPPCVSLLPWGSWKGCKESRDVHDSVLTWA